MQPEQFSIPIMRKPFLSSAMTGRWSALRPADLA
jgi:hypothetical protein